MLSVDRDFFGGFNDLIAAFHGLQYSPIRRNRQTMQFARTEPVTRLDLETLGPGFYVLDESTEECTRAAFDISTGKFVDVHFSGRLLARIREDSQMANSVVLGSRAWNRGDGKAVMVQEETTC